MTAGTLFDLASLTKVVATTTAVLTLAGRRQLGLDDLAARYLPGFTALRDGPVTIRHLLAHTSGLPDTRKFYQWCSTRDELLRDLFATPLEAPPGTRVAYSDLGFLALGEIVAAVADEPLDAAVRGLVTGPLGMTSTGYTPDAAPDRFAATERREDGTPWNGVVHDENARLMGGVAGHAGLFSCAADLAAFCAWWVSAADAPAPATLRREAESCQTAGLGGQPRAWLGAWRRPLRHPWRSLARLRRVAHRLHRHQPRARLPERCLDGAADQLRALRPRRDRRQGTPPRLPRRGRGRLLPLAREDGSHDGDPAQARAGAAATGTDVTPGGSAPWTAKYARSVARCGVREAVDAAPSMKRPAGISASSGPSRSRTGSIPRCRRTGCPSRRCCTQGRRSRPGPRQTAGNRR